jgi:hypothetical protein
MKNILRILIALTLFVFGTTLYWTAARYTTLVYDEFLEPEKKWGNVTPFTTCIFSIVTIFILAISLKYYACIQHSINTFNSIKIGIGISIPFILIATLFWSDSWSNIPNNSVPDARELGDGIFSIGHPLTFLIIDLPIYLRNKFDNIRFLWSDYWAYPSVVCLFIIQTTIYIHGIRLAINIAKINAACKTPKT